MRWQAHALQCGHFVLLGTEVTAPYMHNLLQSPEPQSTSSRNDLIEDTKIQQWP